MHNSSLGPGSALGEKEKNQPWRKKKIEKKSRAVVWEGERVATFPPSPGHRWARFARQHFSYLTPFFAFFPHCGAWSQASITVVTSELNNENVDVPDVMISNRDFDISLDGKFLSHTTNVNAFVLSPAARICRVRALK